MSIVITIPYWQGDSDLWTWLRYGMTTGCILTIWCIASHSRIQYSWHPLSVAISLDTIDEPLAKIKYRWLRVKKVVVKKSMILEAREGTE
jgi:hypothetical protein